MATTKKAAAKKKPAAKKAAPAQRKRGRPTLYTEEKADKIIKEVSGGTPLAQVCREMVIPLSTVKEWIDRHPDFSSRFARAREEGEEVMAADCLRISDTPMDGVEVEEDADGNILKVKRGDMLQHRKLQIETRLKLLAKWNPKKWGDKLGVGGADELPSIKTESVTDPVETARRVAFVLAKGLAAKKPADESTGG